MTSVLLALIGTIVPALTVIFGRRTRPQHGEQLVAEELVPKPLESSSRGGIPVPAAA